MSFCADYKILTKIISSRLKTTLEHTVSKEQTCGIPYRSIFSNLFTIRELIDRNKSKNKYQFINSYIQQFHKRNLQKHTLHQIQ